MRACSRCLLLLAVGIPLIVDAATWQFAAGPTRSDGSAVEVARATARWETALGYIGDQKVMVRTVQDTCQAGPAGPDCVTETSTAERRVGD
ncbi:MAG: hypothetical protein ABIX37_01960 [Gammaproteobacteria bacterium]